MSVFSNWAGRVAFAVGAACSLFGAAAHSATADSADLTVDISGFKSTKGHAIAKLYKDGENVLGKPSLLIKTAIHGGKASVSFAGLKPGPYAVVVFQDLNDNGEIDHNLFGLPAEPLGFSNGFSPGIVAGMPSFPKLRFELGPKDKTISITVHTL
jgi:uncharacterized protein (DUF2141 family)